MERVFFHGTGDIDAGFDVMLEIFKSGGIKSLRLMNIDYPGLYNGMDYISVCAWDDNINHDVSVFESAFNGWVFGCMGFIISGEIEAIKCEYRKGSYDSSKERVSKYKDEWHVKDFIPLSSMVGVFLPLSDNEFISVNQDKVDEIVKISNELGLDIFDSNNNLIEEVNKKYIKKI